MRFVRTWRKPLAVSITATCSGRFDGSPCDISRQNKPRGGSGYPRSQAGNRWGRKQGGFEHRPHGATDSHSAYSASTVCLAFSWRLVDFAAVRGSFQDDGSASSSSSALSAVSARSISASRSLARLARFLDGAPPLPARGGAGGGAGAATRGAAGFARFAVAARSARRRTYSGQPPT